MIKFGYGVSSLQRNGCGESPEVQLQRFEPTGKNALQTTEKMYKETHR